MASSHSAEDFEKVANDFGENPYEWLDTNNTQLIYAKIGVIDDLGYVNASKAVELQTFDRPGVIDRLQERADELRQQGE